MSGGNGHGPGGASGFITREGEVTTIELTGELDIAGVPALREEIERLSGSTAQLVIDLGDLTFIDSAGLRLLLLANDLCARRECSLRLLPGPPNVQRVFEISGVLDALPFARR
jgi:anti-anti-sigma factor